MVNKNISNLIMCLCGANLTMEQKTTIYQLVVPSINPKIIGKMSECMYMTTLADKLTAHHDKSAIFDQCNDLLRSWNIIVSKRKELGSRQLPQI